MRNISIVIPVFNRAKVVQRTLDSVLAQQYRPLQVVLVDNCSTDDTLAVLEAFAAQHGAPDFEVKVVQEPVHTAGAARNRGAQEASGEWIMFFDSDDEMDSKLVDSYVKCIDDNDGDVDIVSTGAVIKFTDGTQRSLPFFTRDILAVQVLHSQLATQRYIVRKQCFEACGKWNATLPAWNDWELGMRLLLTNPRITYLEREYVTVNHSGEQSITGNNFKSKAGVWENVIDNVEQQVNASALHHKQRYQLLLQYKRLVLAAQYHREGEASLARNLYESSLNAMASSYNNGLYWKLVVSPVVKWLYRRIVAGKRGSARIAIKLF